MGRGWVAGARAAGGGTGLLPAGVSQSRAAAGGSMWSQGEGGEEGYMDHLMDQGKGGENGHHSSYPGEPSGYPVVDPGAGGAGGAQGYPGGEQDTQHRLLGPQGLLQHDQVGGGQ